MRRVFNSDELEKEFQEAGYVRIPFLDKAGVDELKEVYFSTLPERGGNILANETGIDAMSEITYDFTFIDKNIDYKRKVFEIISKKFQPIADQYLFHYEPIIANYIFKKSDGGEVPLHQNWAFINERKATSISVWCPLVDSNVENGTLQFVPGSHKRFGEFRGPMVPWELEGIKKEIIEKHLVPSNLKAGEAVILDDSVIHYSNINRTKGLRLAIQLIMIPEGMPSIHYHLDQEKDPDNIEVLEVSHDFFMEFNPWKKPGNVKRIGKVPFQPSSLSEKDFLKRMKAPRFDEERKGLLSKLKSFLIPN